MKRKENERILLCGQKEFEPFFEEARKRYGQDCAQFQFSYELGPIETDWMGNHITGIAESYDTIIFCVANERSAQIAQRLKPLKKRVIILSVLTPVPVLDFDWADSILCGYSYSPFSFKALFGALNGEFTPRGNLPIKK